MPVQVPRSPALCAKSNATKAKAVVASARLYQNIVELWEREYTLENMKAATKNKPAVEATDAFVIIVANCGMLDPVAQTEKTTINSIVTE